MRHSMKRAIAFVLSLTMVLSLPMAASASGVQDLFDVDDQAAGEGFYDSGSETDTGTNSDTDTTTRPAVFDPGQEESIYPSILKVVLDKTEMELDAGGLSGELRADLIYDREALKDYTYEQLISLVKFRTYYTDPAGVTSERGSNQYLKLDWTKEESATGVARCDVHARKQGKVQVFAFFDANDDGKRDPGECKSDEITVKITELANDKNTKFYEDLTFYEGQKVDLNALIDTTVDKDGNAATTSWEALEGKLSWSVSDDSVVSGKKTKTATVDAKGVAAMKKAGSATFFAVGKKTSFMVKVTIKKKAEGNMIKSFEAVEKKQSLEITDAKPVPERDLTVSAKATTGSGDITDYVTWTVKNPKNQTVVEVEPNAPRTVGVPGKTVKSNAAFTAKIKGLNVGKATVTATSSTGKKVNFTVTVTAPLNKLTLNTADTYYTGQTVQLDVVRDPQRNNDKLAWKVKAVTGKATGVKVKNGVLTIANNAADGAKVEITVSGKNKNKQPVEAKKVITVKQVYLDGFENAVFTPSRTTATVPQKVTFSAPDNIVVKDSKGNEVKDIDYRDLLTWSSSKAKALSIKASNDEKVAAVGETLAAGKSIVKVTGIVQKGTKLVQKKITAGTVTVKSPVTSLKVKKSVLGVTPPAKGSKKVMLQASQQLPKGCTKEIVKWTVVDSTIKSINKDSVTDTKPDKVTNKGQLLIPAGTESGVITVRGTATNGATVTQKIYVTDATKKVLFDTKIGTGDAYKDQGLAPVAPTNAKKGSIALGQKTLLNCLINSNDHKAASAANYEPIVSCTVTGKGGAKVELRKDGMLTENFKYVREGNEVWITPTKAGNVTIKVTTASGKSASYTLTIKGEVVKNEK